MAYQTLNNTEQFVTIRTKINSNFALAESTSNKATAISSTPSDAKYPTEKAVADYASKIYQSATIPTTRSGDLLLRTTGTNSGKIMYNSGGTLGEFVPDRAKCNYQTAAAFASSNPTLLAGELAVESDTRKQKVGNGTSPYLNLAYMIADAGSDSGITYGGNNDNGYGIEYQNGWIKYPNGMILQWGLAVYESTGSGSFDRVVNLPTPFLQKRIYSHGVLEIETTDWDNDQVMIHPRSYGNTALRFVVREGLKPYAGYELHWMAIGF